MVYEFSRSEYIYIKNFLDDHREHINALEI